MKSEIVYRIVPSYTMKIRIYPNREQREQIDSYLTALEKAANVNDHAPTGTCRTETCDPDQPYVNDHAPKGTRLAIQVAR